MQTFRSLACTIVVGVAVSLGTASPASDVKKGPLKAAKDEGKAALIVRASPAMAFAPALIRVRAELKGGAANGQSFYCPTIEWDWGDGTISESSADCEPYEPNKSEIQRTFTTEHVYKFGGEYVVQLRLKRQNRVVVTGAAMLNIGRAIDESDRSLR